MCIVVVIRNSASNWGATAVCAVPLQSTYITMPACSLEMSTQVQRGSIFPTHFTTLQMFRYCAGMRQEQELNTAHLAIV